MSVIKNKSTAEGRAFWKHVEEVAKKVTEQLPDWAKTHARPDSLAPS